MVPVLADVTIAVAVGAAAYGAWLVLRDRLTDVPMLVAVGVVELLLVGQLVVGLVEVAATDRSVPAGLFVGYLLTGVLVPPAGLLWGLLEHSRWGPAVVVGACLACCVLVVRLQTIWAGGG